MTFETPPHRRLHFNDLITCPHCVTCSWRHGTPTAARADMEDMHCNLAPRSPSALTQLGLVKMKSLAGQYQVQDLSQHFMS